MSQDPSTGPNGTMPPAGPPQTQPAEPNKSPDESSHHKLIARYGIMKRLGEFAHDLNPTPSAGTKVVARTDRGVELAEVVVGIGCDRALCVSPERVKSYFESCEGDHSPQTGGKILRLAGTQDLIDQRHLNESSREAFAFCRELIRKMELPMKLVTAEHLLGGERIIFYFLADLRVDFRELVRQLAGQYRTRIEMRQVGARDEARLVGDYERCGQRCCCQNFINELKPVSMRMAKIQKATLDPTKISGRCGRLMCCLRFEDESYEELRQKLPRKNTFVRVEAGVGKVIETQIITQLVKLLMPDGAQHLVRNDEILQTDQPAPDVFPPPQSPAASAKPQKPPRGARIRLAELADTLNQQAHGDGETDELSADQPQQKNEPIPNNGPGIGSDRQLEIAPSLQDIPSKPTQPASPAGQSQSQPQPDRQNTNSKRRRRRRKKRHKDRDGNTGGRP